jgi:hypothetical protein
LSDQNKPPPGGFFVCTGACSGDNFAIPFKSLATMKKAGIVCGEQDVVAASPYIFAIHERPELAEVPLRRQT